MDYKKKYKEALKTARKINNGKEVAAPEGWTVCEVIFPELKESEDEKVRKAIIAHIKGLKYYDIYYGVSPEEMVAWLEKQGEKSQGKTALETWKDMRLEVYQQASGNRHEPNYSDDTTKMFSLNDIDEIMEKISEQKLAEKVEPKFHEGEWVVWQNKCYKVNYNGCGYKLIDQNGLSTSLEYGTVDENAHLWTIQDAKNGDALVYKDEISLYKHDIKNCTKQETTFGGFVYHCCYDCKRFITNSLYSLTEQDKIDIHPATKEQRDTLFAKMKEAGYELDAEKKELREIEHNENEKIKKWLIGYFHQYKEDGIEKYANGLKVDSIIAWLEKQGNTNEPINRDEFIQAVLKGVAINLITWIDYKVAEGNMCLSNTECKDIIDALANCNWDKIYDYMKKKLEKQEEL